MRGRGGGGDVEDPLEGYEGLSLFRRTFPSLPPSHLDPHDFLLSLPVKDTGKLMEQAKPILEGTADFEIPKSSQQDDPVGGRTEGIEGGPRGRRPGLGLKRARQEFRLRPETSGRRSVVPEPGLDIDKLKDPEEFFLAFERHQNAKKEMAKQTGQVLPEQQHSTVWNPRPRRPGIPGRSRTFEYKHLYPSTTSQEVSQENVVSTSDIGTEEEMADADVALQEGEVENNASEEGEQSVTATENRVSQLLDELLACNVEDLDGDGAMNLLQERLQIKPRIVQKLKLPEMPEVRRADLNTPGRALAKGRNALSDIQNLLVETKGKASLKQKKSGGSLLCLGSPTPPRSPLASLLLLRRSIVPSDPISNPFLAGEIADSPARNTSPVENIDKGSDPNVENKFSDSRALKRPSNTSRDDNIDSIGPRRDVGVNEGFAAFGYSNYKDNEVVKENEFLSHADTDIQENKTTESKDAEEGAPPGVADSAHTNLNRDENTVISHNLPNQADKSGAVIEDHPVFGLSKTHGSATAQTQDAAPEKTQDSVLDEPRDNAPDQHNKQNQGSSVISINEQTEASINERTKAKSRPRKEHQKKGLSRRQSLAASGTSWETGVRRSTRIKSRPLEYWKGERFLYGRIHDSLVTVIGIKKFDSPENGKRTLKVKSFVSEEFKDLLDLAALD